jgi:hypothetical protein
MRVGEKKLEMGEMEEMRVVGVSKNRKLPLRNRRVSRLHCSLSGLSSKKRRTDDMTISLEVKRRGRRRRTSYK